MLIERTDTALALYGKLCEATGKLLDELLPLMKIGMAPKIPQDISRGSYFGGRNPEDGRINWNWPAERIYNLIRAVTDPYPGAFCQMQDGSNLMIWWGIVERALPSGQTPGTVEIEGERVFVEAGQGRIQLLDIQAGSEHMTGEKIIRFFLNKEGRILK